MGSATSGPPRKYTPEIAAEICDRISAGEPLEAICRDDRMPSAASVYEWQRDEDCRPKNVPATFALDFARARRLGHDAIAAECFAIADDARNDWMQRHGDDAAGWVANGEHIQRSKLRIETRMKLLAKWDKRYADRTVVAGDPEAPIKHEITAIERIIIDPDTTRSV